jgi:hypothetical protein
MRRSATFFGILLLHSSAVAQTASPVPGNPSAVTQAQALGPWSSCQELTQVWDALVGLPDLPSVISARERIYALRAADRRSGGNCLRQGPPGTQVYRPVGPRTLLEQVFPDLVEETRVAREQCGAAPNCPPAEELELELAALTIYLAQKLDKEDLPKLREAFRTIVVVVRTAPTIDEMIEVLRKHPNITPQQAEKLFEVFDSAGNDSAKLQKVTEFLKSRKTVSTTEVEALLAAAAALCGKSRCPEEHIRQVLEVNRQLNDPKQRDALVRTLKLLERYPGIEARAGEVLKQVRSNRPDAARAISDLFKAIGPLVLMQVQLSSDRDTQIPAPLDVSFIPVAVAKEPAVTNAGLCQPDAQFWTTYIEFLHFNLGGESAFRVPIIVETSDTASTWTRFDRVSKTILSGGTPSKEACTAFPDVCSPPLPGTVLLSMKMSKADSIEVAGTCWVDPTGEGKPKVQALFSTNVPAGCSRADEDMRRAEATRLAVDAPGSCSLFKPRRYEAPPGPTRSSGWYALAFAGAPYLQDSRASAWSQWVTSGLDVGLFAGSAVAFGISIDQRNDYARGRADSLRPANDWLGVGIGLGIGWLSARVASGLGYAYAGSVWQRGEP